MTTVTTPAAAERRLPYTRFLRSATTPGKLRLLLAGLVVLCLVWGVVAAVTVAEHSAGAADVVTTSEPLSLDAQQIYRSLSDADATATTAFLFGGLEPVAARHRYQADIARAASSLGTATAAAGGSAAVSQLATLTADLPIYAGEVETARADNRLGLPLGAAYLREASALMRNTLLPAADNVYVSQKARLAAAIGQATGLPLAVVTVLVGLAAGYVFYRTQRWLAGRTHRTVNYGLAVASLAGVASLVWLIVALAVARADLLQAAGSGSAPVEALARADIVALQAHADESLTLIDNGGDDAFQADFLAAARALGPGQGTLLTVAATAARGSPGGSRAVAASADATAWFAAHRQVRALDNSGERAAAVTLATGPGPRSSGALFGRLDSDLTAAISVDQAVFEADARSGSDALAGLEAGVIVGALMMAAGCAQGLSRRLAEYR